MLRAIVLLPGAMTVVLPAVLIYAQGGPVIGFKLAAAPLAALVVLAGAALRPSGSGSFTARSHCSRRSGGARWRRGTRRAGLSCEAHIDTFATR